jgi:hypothetical protein
VGKEPEEIKKEIEEARQALGQKVDVLADQLKDGVQTVRTTGLKVGGAVLALVVGFLTIKKIREKRR